MSAKYELPEYLTLKEVPGLVRVHEKKFLNWVGNGTLKAIRIYESKIRHRKKEDVIKFLVSGNH